MRKSLPICALLLLLSQGQALADPQLYVTGEYTITLRTGPSLQNKVIADLKNDTKIEKIKDEGEWMYVRTPDGKTGYVMRRYLTTKTPLATEFEEYKARNKEMIEKAGQIQAIVAKYDEEKKSLEKSLGESRAERDTLARNYEDLRTAAADVVGIESKYRQAQAELSNTNSLLETTKVENESLKNTRDLRWFLSGAGVLFMGWLLGFITGSINKKRKSSRLYM